MEIRTRVLVAAAMVVALAGCASNAEDAAEAPTESPLVAAFDVCSERSYFDADTARLTDTPEVLIEGAGMGPTVAAKATFECVANETGAPESLMQKVGSTSHDAGRQEVTYDGITVSWTYSAVGDGRFEGVFESAA